MSGVDTFDYFRADDGIIFIGRSDSHPDDYFLGLPVYTPNQNGERSLNGLNYSKTSRNGESSSNGLYSSHLSDIAVNVPEKNVVEVRKPSRRTEQMLEEVDDEVENLYREVDDLVDGSIGVIGSHIYGLNTEESDVDIIVQGEDPEYLRTAFDNISTHPELEPLGEDVLESKSEKYADRFEITEDEALHHITNPERRYNHSKIDSKISFIPVHEPGENSDYPMPEKSESSRLLETEGVVTEDELSFASPRIFSVDTEIGNIDVLTTRWIYAGSYQEGDRVRIEAELFEESEKAVLNKIEHDLSPV